MTGKIGFIGLGLMGKPMSRNLIKAGAQLVIYDIDKASVESAYSRSAGLWQPQLPFREQSELFRVHKFVLYPSVLQQVHAAPTPEQTNPPLRMRRNSIVRKAQL